MMQQRNNCCSFNQLNLSFFFVAPAQSSSINFAFASKVFFFLLSKMSDHTTENDFETIDNIFNKSNVSTSPTVQERRR
jgi:hypothetical protein